MTDNFDMLSFVGGVATAASAAYVLMNSEKPVVENEKDEGIVHSANTSSPAYDPKIKEELTTRVKSFFGQEKFDKLEEKFVIVVGLGGVGSHAANMLVRSGIRRIRLVDFDQVTLSSLNRHAVANLGDVGISKAESMRRHFHQIVPWCEVMLTEYILLSIILSTHSRITVLIILCNILCYVVLLLFCFFFPRKVEAVTEMFRGDSAEQLLGGNPDYVLDCIDDVKTKAELLAFCSKKGLKVLTSMGAGGKSDPTRLRIGTLADCVKDPLASKVD